MMAMTMVMGNWEGAYIPGLPFDEHELDKNGRNDVLDYFLP